MGVRVTPVEPSERDAVIALWHAAGLTRYWNDPVLDFDLSLANPTSNILVARDCEAIVGSIMVGFDGHRGWVYYLASDPSRRCEGIGRALMTAAEDWLRACGCPKIQLMMRSDNQVARGFYTAIGYEVQDVVMFGRRLDGTN